MVVCPSVMELRSMTLTVLDPRTGKLVTIVVLEKRR
jgi:hypothetical protein